MMEIQTLDFPSLRPRPPRPKPRLAISAPPSPGKSSSSWRWGLVDGHLRVGIFHWIYKSCTNHVQVMYKYSFLPLPGKSFEADILQSSAIVLWWKSVLLRASSSAGVSWLQRSWGISWSSFPKGPEDSRKVRLQEQNTLFPSQPLFPSNTFRMGSESSK